MRNVWVVYIIAILAVALAAAWIIFGQPYFHLHHGLRARTIKLAPASGIVCCPRVRAANGYFGYRCSVPRAGDPADKGAIRLTPRDWAYGVGVFDEALGLPPDEYDCLIGPC